MNLATTLTNFSGIEVTEKKKTFTSLLMIPVFAVTMFFSACTPNSVLADGEKILSYIPLALNIALPIVCLDAAICSEATIAIQVTDAAQAVVLQLFQQWQAASVAAQPGILAQLQAAIQVLSQKYTLLLAAFKISSSTVSAEVGAILAAVLLSIQQIASLTGAVVVAGGTMASLKAMKVGNLYTPSRFKSDVLSAVKKKTGDTKVDSMNSAFQQQVRSW